MDKIQSKDKIYMIREKENSKKRGKKKQTKIPEGMKILKEILLFFKYFTPLLSVSQWK